MAITASMVKELRERTGAGMMDCKRALTEVDGDIDEAVKILRRQGLDCRLLRISTAPLSAGERRLVAPDRYLAAVRPEEVAPVLSVDLRWSRRK